MIVILTGAQKNIGDYLIGARAKKLLQAYVDQDLVELNRRHSMAGHLKQLNQARAVILCGGPAYTANIYPDVYPLLPEIGKIRPPIIPFGLGWGGRPRNKMSDFRFTPQALGFLKQIHQQIAFSSCRDVLTHQLLQNAGISNVLMTGCPVWYQLKCLNQAFHMPTKIRRLVFTTPASPSLTLQTCAIIKLLKRHYPDAQIFCSFHRGIWPDRQTSLSWSAAFLTMAAFAKALGLEVVDVSYDLQRIDFYRECDLHIGYRVHAHLDFLSHRIPSILINEDGRGQGMVTSMGLPLLNADDASLLKKIEVLLSEYQTTIFADFDRVGQYIDKTFQKMCTFLKQIC